MLAEQHIVAALVYTGRETARELTLKPTFAFSRGPTWDYADGFGFVRRAGEREIPDEIMVDALLGGRSARPR